MNILNVSYIHNELTHEIMVLFVLSKLTLQTRMRSHPVGLHVWFLVGPFVYLHTSCVRTVQALARLSRCTGLPQPSLFTYVISTIISRVGSITAYEQTQLKTSLLHSYLVWKNLLFITYKFTSSGKTLTYNSHDKSCRSYRLKINVLKLF